MYEPFEWWKSHWTHANIENQRSRSNPKNFWNRISRKRYKTERKCQKKFDRESRMCFRRLETYSTKGIQQRSKVKVKPQKFWSRISRIRFEMKEKRRWKFDKKSCMSSRIMKIFSTQVDLLRSKVKIKPQKLRSRICRKRCKIERKYQLKMNGKLLMGFRMLETFLTSVNHRMS